MIKDDEMMEKRKLRTVEVSLIIFGCLIGYVLSLAPEPLLRFLVYRDFNAQLAAILLSVCVVILLITIFAGKHPFGITRKRAYRMFSIGVSIASFFLAFYTFISYPSIIASANYLWLDNWYVGNVSVGSLVFFIASILWDTMVGSAFAVLEHFF